MLAALAIRDIVVIDRLRADFSSGMTVFTGETGAGKSILLDALSLALGGRGDASLVRAGAERGDVSAVFEIAGDHPVQDLLSERGLDRSEDIILRRVQNADGRSRAFINDEPVSVGLLRDVGALLVEIHGQHDDRAMIDASAHRRLLDAFGDLGRTADSVAEAWAEWRARTDELAALNNQIAAARDDGDYLRAVVEELAMLDPQEGEETELAEARTAMMRAEKISGDISEAHETVAGAGSPAPALASLLRRLERKAADAGGLLDAPIRSLDSVLTALQETEDALNAAVASVRIDPDALERCEERLFALRAVSRKHSVPVEELPTLMARMAADLEKLDSGEERLGQLEEKTAAALEDYRRKASKLSRARETAGKSLAGRVTTELPDLKLKSAEFVIEVSSDEQRIVRSGFDAVSFLVSTNPGTAPSPLMKTASGGELARFLLALKVSLAEKGSAPTLIFDEIDTAVGGAVADAIGVRLARLAERVQVLSVTHAPQVAARAGAHVLVTKQETGRGRQVATGVATLDSGARREEIARMLAGAAVTDEARAAADRLILGAA
jgi:DNA repair protein RecN (Recombination protein N)